MLIVVLYYVEEENYRKIGLEMFIVRGFFVVLSAIFKWFNSFLVWSV